MTICSSQLNDKTKNYYDWRRSWCWESMHCKCPRIYGFFFYNPGCLGQFTSTTINPWIHWTPCKLNGQIRYRGGDMHAQKGSNPDAEKKNKALPPLGHELKCRIYLFLPTTIQEEKGNKKTWKHVLDAKFTDHSSNLCQETLGIQWLFVMPVGKTTFSRGTASKFIHVFCVQYLT